MLSRILNNLVEVNLSFRCFLANSFFSSFWKKRVSKEKPPSLQVKTYEITITIDNKPVKIPKKSLLIEAIQKSGSTVTTDCQNPSIPGSGGVCKSCIVEDISDKEAKPIISCITNVKEGMKISTKSANLEQTRLLFKHQSKSIHKDAQEMLKKAEIDKVETAWDRFEKQKPQCGFCEKGVSCRTCTMGPCRVDETGKWKAKKGVCGADSDIIVARNLARMIASGAASHSDHARDLVELLHKISLQKTQAQKIADSNKLKTFSKEFGLDFGEDSDTNGLARVLSEALMEEQGIKKSRLTLLKRAPQQRIKLWEKLNVIPRGIDRETAEMMHRTHMGVDNNQVSILLQATRNALSDAFGGSMIATELTDILFGTPKPGISEVNLGVLKEDHVNILVHGHDPIVSEMIHNLTHETKMIDLAISKGAKGINLGGMCCTGNEMLMRKKIPMAGNHLMSELAIITGAVEAIVVDYQCIMPSLGQVAQCYHTKLYSTSEKAKFNFFEHIEFTAENAYHQASKILIEAINNFQNRRGKVNIPVLPVKTMTGFSVESILSALGGSLKPLIDAIVSGKIKGAVGVVGCNNPKVKHDQGHVELIKELIKNDVLVLTTGCANVAAGKAGLQVPEAKELAGPGLKEICSGLGVPPSLHVGSCVDNSRILVIAMELAKAIGVDIDKLPLAAAAQEWYSEKAATIGLQSVACGIYTVLGVVPPVLGSKNVTGLLTSGLNDVFGACFDVEPDPRKSAEKILSHIKKQRKALGLQN